MIQEININYNIVGNPNTKVSSIRKGDFESIDINEELPFNYSNITNADWITIDHNKKIIKIANGEQIVKTNIIFPKKYQVYIFPGTVLKLQNNANLFFQGPVFIEGDKAEVNFDKSSNKKIFLKFLQFNH